MPKAHTVTFDVEPSAVLIAVDWIVKRDPFSRSIFLDVLTPEQRIVRETEYLERLNRAARHLIGWLRRRKRLEQPMLKAKLCIDRDLAEWMATFDRSRSMGIFGSPKHKETVPIGAQYFFSQCSRAVSRRVGRPRLSPLDAAARLAAAPTAEDMPMSSRYRLMAREAEALQGTLNAMLRLATDRKNSLIN